MGEARSAQGGRWNLEEKEKTPEKSNLQNLDISGNGIFMYTCIYNI